MGSTTACCVTTQKNSVLSHFAAEAWNHKVNSYTFFKCVTQPESVSSSDANYVWNKEAEYQICWRFSEWRQCGFGSSAYGGTNVPINIRTAGVETRIGFSYSVTRQPDVVTWQHSSLKPVSSYCKTKYGRTTRRKAAGTESDARRFASNDESRVAVDINLVLKLFIQFGPNLRFYLVKSGVSKPQQ